MAATAKGMRLSTRHVPQRTCIGCRGVKPKRELVRVVRSVAGSITVDPTGKAPGRGVYICKAKSCWDNALRKGNIDRALYPVIVLGTLGDGEGKPVASTCIVLVQGQLAQLQRSDIAGDQAFEKLHFLA